MTYVDDVRLLGKTIEKCLEILKETLKRLAGQGFEIGGKTPEDCLPTLEETSKRLSDQMKDKQYKDAN